MLVKCLLFVIPFFQVELLRTDAMNKYTAPAYILPSEHYFCELRAVEVRGNGQNATYGKGHKFTGSKPKGIDKSQKSVKLDSKGVPYNYPELRLPKKEYGKVIRAIDDLYASKYEGKSKGWLTLSKETYKFEIHGFNEYNIYEKRKG